MALLKKVLFVGLTILSGFTNINSLSCISIKSREYKTRLQVVNVNGDEAVLFPFSIEPSKCSGKLFNLTSRTNEIRFI